MPENTAKSISFRARWNLDPAGVPVPVNQILLRAGIPVGQSQEPSDEFYVTFGHLNAPAVVPTDPNGGFEILGVDNGVGTVSVVGHFAISRARLEEFRMVLNNWLDEVPPTSTGR